MRGRSPGAFARRLPGCMFGRCALRLRQCIPFARKRGVLSRRSAAGSGSLVARHRQVHAPCGAEAGNGHKRAKQADRHGVLGYKGARRKRLAHRNASRGRRGSEPPNMSHTDRERARCSRRSMLPESAPIWIQLNGADCSVFEESGVGSDAEGF